MILTGKLESVGNDFLAKVPIEKGRFNLGYILKRQNKLVDEASATEFGIKAMAKNFSETTLMVVESLFSFVIDGTDINYDITGAQDGFVPRSFQIWVGRI